MIRINNYSLKKQTKKSKKFKFPHNSIGVLRRVKIAKLQIR